MTTMRGFYGKIPSHGDFIDRGVPAGFKEPLDEWLQHGLAASRSAIGEDWLNVYLTSPVWRFATTPGACGAQAWAGVMVPSVDRVGRYFPLIIATEIPAEAIPLQVVTAGANWLESAEAIAFRALEQDTVDAEAIAAAVEGLGEMPLGAAVLDARPAAGTAAAGSPLLSMPFSFGTSPGQGLLALTHRLLEARCGSSYSLWWTFGSDLVHPGIVSSSMLPPPESYAGFLSDSATPLGWERLQGYELSTAIAVEAPTVPNPTAQPTTAAELLPGSDLAAVLATPAPAAAPGEAPAAAPDEAPAAAPDEAPAAAPGEAPAAAPGKQPAAVPDEDPAAIDSGGSLEPIEHPETEQVSADDILAELSGGETKDPS